DCKGQASGVSAYVDALEEDRLRGVAGPGLGEYAWREDRPGSTRAGSKSVASIPIRAWACKSVPPRAEA
ncbi:hypothetical protein, partial [Cupriavidus sp. SK-3]|uniref:hypothetical protein n=1 Tax=Cupriavidus sp. SK-3 TaxID=1470558 RepID=UPI001F483EC2